MVGKHDRTKSLLAHSGQRIGGNDLDIHLAFRQLMPLFGFGSKTQKGTDMPISQFWNAIAINNVAAQTDFYGSSNFRALDQLRRDAAEPEKLKRLIQVYHDTLGYQIVRKAEESKIALSDAAQYCTNINVLSECLQADISQSDMAAAIESPRIKMAELVIEAMQQSDKKPDVIYMTGGTARSPILRASIEALLPDVPIVSGSYFGSVTAGLARWAQHCFK